MYKTFFFDGTTSDPFLVNCEVIQGYVIELTLSRVLLSMLFRHTFNDCSEGVNNHTRADGGLFDIARLRAKNKFETVLIRDLLFAKGAAVTSHTEADLQKMFNCFIEACK